MLGLRVILQRRVQPKQNVFKPTSYKDLDDLVINKRTCSIDSSDTGEEDIVSKRMDKEEYSPSRGDVEEEDDEDELESYDDDDDDAVEALADPSPSTGHSTDIYGHLQQSYHHQENYVAFLQE